MSGNGAIRTTVVVTNPLGLHFRPADAFARLARTYRSSVTVWNGPRRADGKSSSDLILLLAFPGDQLVLEVEGDDATSAIGPLADLLGSAGESH